MTRKQRRLVLIGSALGVLALAVGLVLTRSRIRSSFSIRRPTWSKRASLPARGCAWRLGQGGQRRAWRNLAVRFAVTDAKSTVPVAYQGLLPDLFREGQGW
jgi:cytochrome c-type biogenesis protein CcmE